jgi:hypothetical protein
VTTLFECMNILPVFSTRIVRFVIVILLAKGVLRECSELKTQLPRGVVAEIDAEPYT